MNELKLLYEGKAKRIYETADEHVLLVQYMDQITALDGLKKEQMASKGALNNQITSLIFEVLSDYNVPNHFIKKTSETEQLVKRLHMLPLEVVVRNVAAGSFSKRLGVAEGTPLVRPIIEFYYKNDALHDPIINDDHVVFLDIATDEEIIKIKRRAFEVNEALIRIFESIGIRLVDFKIEFGKDEDGQILLGDEVTPDTCRLWDMDTNERLDKDLYRRDLGDVIPVYKEVLRRLTHIN